jgi:hypothetical protein
MSGPEEIGRNINGLHGAPGPPPACRGKNCRAGGAGGFEVVDSKKFFLENTNTSLRGSA